MLDVAGLNVLRFHLEKLNVENFELSQNFLYFMTNWKINYFCKERYCYSW